MPPPPAAEFHRFAQTGDRLGYERIYFARRRRLVALLATAALAAGAPQGPPGPLLADLASEMDGVCAEPSWALPAHAAHATALGRGMDQCVDLFAAETAHTLAEALALLGPWLPAALRARVARQIEHRVLGPLCDDPRQQLWESWANNWSAVCAGAAGMAALALGLAAPRLERLLVRVRAALRTFLSGFGPDGGCAEGVGYWVYGFGYFTYFAETLRERTGEDLLGAGAHAPLLRQIAAFPHRVALGGGAYVSFSDSPRRAVLPSGLLCRLADRLGAPVPRLPAVPGLHTDHCYRWGHLSRNLAWTEPELLGRPLADATSYLPDLAWVVDRAAAHPAPQPHTAGHRAPEQHPAAAHPAAAHPAAAHPAGGQSGAVHPAGGHPGAGRPAPAGRPETVHSGATCVAVAFAAKGGHNDEPHNHLDLGQFILQVDGDELLADLGAGEYTRDYFGPRRYQALHPGAEGHSVPLLSGRGQLPGPGRAARVLAYRERPDGLVFALDLTAAYDVPGLAALVRTFRWHRPDLLTITDELRTTRPVPLTEQFISRRRPQLTGTGVRWVAGSGAAATLAVRGWTQTLAELSTRDHQGAPDTVYRLRLHRRAPAGSSRFRLPLRIAHPTGR